MSRRNPDAVRTADLCPDDVDAAPFGPGTDDAFRMPPIDFGEDPDYAIVPTGGRGAP